MLKALKDRKVLSNIDYSCLFLIGLLKHTKEGLIVKFKVDDIKPKTYIKYNNFLRAVYKVAKFNITN